jgi:NAD(P)-dependent dehydrogenase (short-subunit alcohol dehydrogenase family)
MINPFKLENKNIVITGAASGIGRQCAISCAEMGARLVLFDINYDGLQGTAELLVKKNDHQLCTADLTDYESVARLLAAAVEKTGRINGLLNCAGISNTLPLKLATPDIVERFFRINVLTGYFMAKEVTKMGILSKEGASIVFFSSVAGSFGQPGKSIYGMTKGALIAGTKSLACELAPKKVRVNAISPGVVVTPINAHLPHIADPEKRKETENLHLLGLGETSDVANACVYLLSDASKWVTGTNLFIDGGYSAR